MRLPYIADDPQMETEEDAAIVQRVKDRRGGKLIALDKTLLHAPAVANGWNSFADEFKKTGNLEAMKRGRMLCYAQAQRAALIRETKVIGGRLAYDIQFPLVQTCQNTQQEATTRLMITALVVRTTIQDKPDGLAIEQLVADAQ